MCLGQNYLDLAKHAKARTLKDALFAKLGPAFRARNAQVNQLRDIINEAGQEIMVCGDFNDTPISYTHHKLSEGLQDAFVSQGNGLGYSFLQGIFAVRIDHILVGDRFTPIKTVVDNTISYSDHYPIITSLRINPSDN